MEGGGEGVRLRHSSCPCVLREKTVCAPLFDADPDKIHSDENLACKKTWFLSFPLRAVPGEVGKGGGERAVSKLRRKAGWGIPDRILAENYPIIKASMLFQYAIDHLRHLPLIAVVTEISCAILQVVVCHLKNRFVSVNMLISQ